jgi:uncharacterized tellurite resistance protein B-like protein
MPKKILNKIKNLINNTKLPSANKEEFPNEESIIPSLEFDKNGIEASPELHLAIATLLVQSSSIDEVIAISEAEVICDILANYLRIPEEEIPKLVELAVETRRERIKFNENLTLLCESYNNKQKILLMSLVWKVFIADEKLEKLEEKMLVQISNKLRVSIEDCEKAKIIAAKGGV